MINKNNIPAAKFNWDTAPTVYFTDLKVGERFMIVGNEIFEKRDEDTAKVVNNSYDTDTYAMSSYTKCKSRGFKKN